MKLELKHLAPYLPYGLKVYHESSNIKIQEMTCFDLSTTMINHFNKWECRPILRPMSDFDDPTKYDNDNYYSFMAELNGSLVDTTATIDRYLDFQIECGNSDSKYFNIIHSYNAYQFLFENHFDVFGLIEKGLAIDINTL